MTIYADLEKLIVENLSEKFDEILCDMRTEQRYDFLVLDRLLTWEETYLSDLSGFFDIALKRPLSIEIASVLISHAILQPMYPEGYSTILNFIRQQDGPLVDYIETQACTFRETQLLLKAGLEQEYTQKNSSKIITQLFNGLISAKLAGFESVELATRFYFQLEQKLLEIYILMQQYSLTQEEIDSLFKEVFIMLEQCETNPFYYGHTSNELLSNLVYSIRRPPCLIVQQPVLRLQT